MEYQRQQLTVAIQQVREKRPAMTANAVALVERTHTAASQSAAEDVVISSRKAIEPPEHASDRSETRKGAIPKVKRVRVNEENAEANDRLAQQIVDWPNRQPPLERPPMAFDAAIIENFLQHAARFCLRRNPLANENDVAELLQYPTTKMYGRHSNPPTDVELAVRTAQKWQLEQEINAMWANAPQQFYSTSAPNPGNYNIHVSFKGETSRHGSTPYVRTITPKRPEATIEEIGDVPRIMPDSPWVFRFSYPGTGTIALSDMDGDINAVIESFRDLPHGVKIRRDGGMIEFIGPPTADVSLSVEYHDRAFRLRLCSAYVIINENFRMDANGVSKIMRNDEALAVIPDWEIGFLGAEFENTRVRFAEQRARLWSQDDELMLTVA